MFQDNPLLAQLKQQIQENLPKKEGTIKATEKGFGFLEVDSKTSFFIPIGRVKMFKGKLNVVPDHPQLKKMSLKAKTKKGLNPQEFAEGDWVVGHLIRHPLKDDNGFFVEISEKITDANDKIAPWWGGS